VAQVVRPGTAGGAEPLGDIELWDLEEPAVAPPMVRPGTAGGAESLSVGDVVFDVEIDVEELAAGLRVGGQWASRRGMSVDVSDIVFDFDDDMASPMPDGGWVDGGGMDVDGASILQAADYDAFALFDVHNDCVGSLPPPQDGTATLIASPSCLMVEEARVAQQEEETQGTSDSCSGEKVRGSRCSEEDEEVVWTHRKDRNSRRRWLRVVSLLVVALALLCVHLWAVPSTQWFDTIAITALVVDALIVQTLYVGAAMLMLG
jgi:hypothetical protein